DRKTPEFITLPSIALENLISDISLGLSLSDRQWNHRQMYMNANPRIFEGKSKPR
ncbi:27196_t:CDS:2, partial [Racocetra persica]